MCGYCLQQAMLDPLEQELRTNAPVDRDRLGELLLQPYTQESNFLVHCAKYARDLGMANQILYILHCRALEEIVLRPKTALQDSLTLGALVKHYHAYRWFISTRLQPEIISDQLPHESWDLLFGPDFLFAKESWPDLLGREELVQECADLLEEYHTWWLLGQDQKKNDLQQRLRETGVLDPIEDIAEAEKKVFYSLFPALYFALAYLSRQSPDNTMLQEIALTPPSGVPDFPGYDLWLQRKALIFSIQNHGADFLLRKIDSGLSIDLIYYAILKLDKIKAQKQSILTRLQTWLDNMHQGSFEAKDLQKYMDMIRSYPEQGKLH